MLFNDVLKGWAEEMNVIMVNDYGWDSSLVNAGISFEEAREISNPMVLVEKTAEGMIEKLRSYNKNIQERFMKDSQDIFIKNVDDLADRILKSDDLSEYLGNQTISKDKIIDGMTQFYSMVVCRVKKELGL